MDNNFYDEFNNFRKNQPNSRMVLEFAGVREYLNKDYLVCFVEGPDDKKFYRFIRNKNTFKEIDKDNYIYANNDKDESLGKKCVLLMYDYINNNYKDSLDKCIFVVDHDYNGLNGYKVNKDFITITKPYSIENYYLNKDNLYLIFNYINHLDDYNDFIELLDGFIYDLSDFVRLKSTITNLKKDSGFRYFKLYDNNKIFKFDFNNVPYFNVDYLNEEVKNMKKAISTNTSALNYYNYLSKEFSGKVEWIRGHDIYKLLKYYIRYNYNIDIDNDKIHSDIIKMIDVDIDIKNGLGEILQ